MSGDESEITESDSDRSGGFEYNNQDYDRSHNTILAQAAELSRDQIKSRNKLNVKNNQSLGSSNYPPNSYNHPKHLQANQAHDIVKGICHIARELDPFSPCSSLKTTQHQHISGDSLLLELSEIPPPPGFGPSTVSTTEGIKPPLVKNWVENDEQMLCDFIDKLSRRLNQYSSISTPNINTVQPTSLGLLKNGYSGFNSSNIINCARHQIDSRPQRSVARSSSQGNNFQCQSPPAEYILYPQDQLQLLAYQNLPPSPSNSSTINPNELQSQPNVCPQLTAEDIPRYHIIDDKKNNCATKSISSSTIILTSHPKVKSNVKGRQQVLKSKQTKTKKPPSHLEKYLFTEPSEWEQRFLPENNDIEIKNVSIEQAMDFLEAPDWFQNLVGLKVIIFLIHHNEEKVTDNLQTIIRMVHRLLRSYKSKLCRQAITCLRELFLHLGPHFFDTELSSIAEKLFVKTTDTNKFIKDEVETALEAMVRYCSQIKIVQILDSVGRKHRNTTVRQVICRMTKVFIDYIGPEECMVEYADKILPMLCNYLNERAIEIRDEAKNALKLVVLLPDFDSLVSQHLSASQLSSVKDKLERIKDEMLERTPKRRRKPRPKMSISIEF